MYLSVYGLDLLQRGQNKDCRLPHTRFSLAEDVHAQDGLGDTLVLHCNTNMILSVTPDFLL